MILHDLGAMILFASFLLVIAAHFSFVLGESVWKENTKAALSLLLYPLIGLILFLFF